MCVGLGNVGLEGSTCEAQDGKHEHRVTLTTFNSILCDARFKREDRESFLPTQTRVKKPLGSFNRVQMNDSSVVPSLKNAMKRLTRFVCVFLCDFDAVSKPFHSGGQNAHCGRY